MKNGFVTFGCLNQFAKVIAGRHCELWVRILQSLPGSRLVLHAPPGRHRDAVRALFADAGIAPDRLEFDAKVPRREYLRRYHQLDLCLDPFPYNGGVTSTLDALWMGVPVITLAGRTGGGPRRREHPLERGPARADRRDAASSTSRSPSRWRGTWTGLSELRAGLRQRMQASPLVDGKQYAADVEAAFRRIWKTWCRS